MEISAGAGMQRISGILLGVLWWVTSAGAQPLNDGPYVLRIDGQRQAIWVCDGEMQVRSIAEDGRIPRGCTDVPAIRLDVETRAAEDALPSADRWAALSDVHGQLGVFLGLLQAHRVIDATHRWSWETGTLVIVGDVFDRGPRQVELLWAIYRLGQEARAAGGRVELLLGNHEMMVMQGDLRYLHPRYREVERLLGRSYDQLFGPDSELGAWLRLRATVLKLGDTLFVHGGLHPQLAEPRFDHAELNTRFRARLAQPGRVSPGEPDAWLFGSDGPIWHRGYFLGPRATTAEVDTLLRAADARRIVVGHTTQDQIRALYAGRVIGVDSGIKGGERGELLIHDGGKLWRGLQDGTRLALPLLTEH